MPKSNIWIPILLTAGVAVFIWRARSAKDESGEHTLRDDPAFKKGFATGFLTPGPGTWLLLAGGGYYVYKNK